MKRAGLIAMMVVGGLALSAGTARANWHYVNVGGTASALWNSCPAVAVGSPCAFTFVVAEREVTDVTGATQRNCVFVDQIRGVKVDDFGLRGNDDTFADACGTAEVRVDAALGHGAVNGTLPARNCRFDPDTSETACTPTTLDLDLAWTGTDDVARAPAVTNRTLGDGLRCVLHALPSRSRAAVATGTIDGLPAPMGQLQDASLSFGGIIDHGTSVGCFD